MPRFVILHHTVPDGRDRPSHWDLMFECGDILRTWALSSEPGYLSEGEGIELAGHRLAYLDYEGPISGDRGSVSQWDAGNCQAIEASDDRWIASLEGARLQTTVTLERMERGSHSWRVSFGAAPRRG